MNCDLRVRLADVSGRLFPLGLDEPAPVFHYLAESAEQGKSISACQLLVQDESGLVIWDSGKSIPPERAYLHYQGAPLAARSIYSAQIRVWDEQDKVSPFSESLQFETGLMGQPWQARWIEPVQENAIFEKALPLHQLFVPSPEFWAGRPDCGPAKTYAKLLPASGASKGPAPMFRLMASISSPSMGRSSVSNGWRRKRASMQKSSITRRMT